MHDGVGRRDRESRGEDAGRQYIDVRPDQEERTAGPRPELEQQDATNGEPAPDERREKGAEQHAHAERREQEPDLTARQALLLADHDDREHHAGPDEVREPEQECGRSQERVLPEKAEPLDEARPQGGSVCLAFLLERRAHREQRGCREQIQHRVDEERQRARDAEERSAEGGAGDAHRSFAPRDHGDRLRQLRRRDDGTKRSRLRSGEDGSAGAFDERDRRDDPVDGLVEQHECAERADRDGPDGVRGDHEPPAVEAVGGEAGGECENGHCEQPEECDDPGLRGRAGERENQQRVRDRGHLRAGARQQQTALQVDEVAVAKEGPRDHRPTLSRRRHA